MHLEAWEFHFSARMFTKYISTHTHLETPASCFESLFSCTFLIKRNGIVRFANYPVSFFRAINIDAR